MIFPPIQRNAAVYSKKEILKILEAKLHKLDILYTKQLEILGDEILLKRKEYLTMRENESESPPCQKMRSSNKKMSPKRYTALVNYRKQSSQKAYLKNKFRRFDSESAVARRSGTSCQYTESQNSIHQCTNQPVPLSNYCQKRNKTHRKQS